MRDNGVSKKESSLPLPDTRGMDWPSLVDTATRAMLQVHEGGDNSATNLGQWMEDMADRLGLDTSTQIL